MDGFSPMNGISSWVTELTGNSHPSFHPIHILGNEHEDSQKHCHLQAIRRRLELLLQFADENAPEFRIDPADVVEINDELCDLS